MYQLPSRRNKKIVTKKPPLTSILDAVFIFIFFLLMTSVFIRVTEIASDAPILSEAPPPKDKRPPLALTLKIANTGIQIYQNLPAVLLRSFPITDYETYDYTEFHEFILSIKEKNMDERVVILDPNDDVSYDAIVKIMDAVRLVEDGDPALFSKNADGIDEAVTTLFDQIVFGNIRG